MIDCCCCAASLLLYPGLACGRFFMEKQVMGEFVRILKLSRTVSVPLQLLQTVSIMVQNLKSEHAICRLIIKWISFPCSEVYKWLVMMFDGLINFFAEKYLQITCLVMSM